MKKYILAVLAAILISASSIVVYAALSNKVAEREVGEGSESGFTYYVTKIDDCEYIVLKRFWLHEGSISITHKGDCSNPIHKK